MAKFAVDRLVLVGMIASVFFPLIALAEEVDVKNLPKAVAETIHARYPKAELTEARKTIEDKNEIYEVDLTDGGKAIEIAVFTDGKIDWVAIDFAIQDLPKKVLAAVRKKYPAAKLNHASTVYTVSNGKDHLEHYQVEITTKSGKKRDLEISPSGEVEEDVESKD